MEILPVYAEVNKERLARQLQIEQILHELDYKVARIKKAIPIGIEPVDQIGIHANMEDSDYLMYPAAMAHDLQAAFSN